MVMKFSCLFPLRFPHTNFSNSPPGAQWVLNALPELDSYTNHLYEEILDKYPLPRIFLLAIGQGCSISTY